MLLYNLCAHYILFTIKPHRTSHIGNACFSYLNPSHWQCPFFLSERTTLAMPFLLFQHTTKAMPVSLISTTHIGNARFSYLNHPTPQSVCYVMPFADRVSCTNIVKVVLSEQGYTVIYCVVLEWNLWRNNTERCLTVWVPIRTVPAHINVSKTYITIEKVLFYDAKGSNATTGYK